MLIQKALALFRVLILKNVNKDIMKTYYNSISLRNKDIDRLSGTTTKSTGFLKYVYGSTPKERADQAAKQAMKDARKFIRKS